MMESLKARYAYICTYHKSEEMPYLQWPSHSEFPSLTLLAIMLNVLEVAHCVHVCVCVLLVCIDKG